MKPCCYSLVGNLGLLFVFTSLLRLYLLRVALFHVVQHIFHTGNFLQIPGCPCICT